MRDGMNNLASAFGDGWLGELVVALVMAAVGGIIGWFGRRPLEKAGVLQVVNDRLKLQMQEQATFLNTIIAAHTACEERLDKLEQAREHDREVIEQLRGLLAQEKQIGASAVRVTEGKS